MTALVPITLNANSFYRLYAPACIEDEGPHFAFNFQFVGSFGTTEFSMEDIKARIIHCNEAAGYCVVALVVSVIVLSLFRRMDLIVLPIIVFAAGIFHQFQEKKTLEKVSALHQFFLSVPEPEKRADALLSSGPYLLQRCWEFGCIPKDNLDRSHQTICEIGNAIVSGHPEHFGDHRSNLITDFSGIIGLNTSFTDLTNSRPTVVIVPQREQDPARTQFDPVLFELQ